MPSSQISPSTTYNKVDLDSVDALRKICGAHHVFCDGETLGLYSRDETEDLVFSPEVVVKPNSAEEISQIMKLACRKNIPVTPRGAGTGLSGGALPVRGGILLSVERMNRILEIDENNLFAVVQPGVITQHLQEAVEKLGLFYPPDPASRGSCFIGGNVAENSGGPRALKYGVTKDYVYGLEAVLPDGQIIQTGGKLLKNVSGYNLTQLFVGSEGTLGIVAKVILKLIPATRHKKTMLAAFPTPVEAARAVTGIFHRRITPCAVEFMERAAIEAVQDHLKKEMPNAGAGAQLLIEVDGNNEDVLMEDLSAIAEVCEANGATDVILAETRAKQDELWSIRRAMGIAVKSISPYKEEDTVVPRANLPKLVEGVREIVDRYGLRAICYGHAGDGNLHVNILKEKTAVELWDKNLALAIPEIFKLTVSLGGTISGEHGIGFSQKEYLPIVCAPGELDAMKRLKDAWDPKGILNPGKIFCDEPERGIC